jgi:hypothetical protein
MGSSLKENNQGKIGVALDDTLRDWLKAERLKAIGALSRGCLFRVVQFHTLPAIFIWVNDKS